ncbi:MAG: hypothetical protein EON48_03865 [Acetobacteraceae bacterium]|nr:MAG: hypothetical protein EON48_03865 [Acetobacteraceae bacterium]
MAFAEAPMPMVKMLLVFLATLIAGNVLLILVQIYLPDLPMPGSVGIVFAMIASMSAGGTAATALGRGLVAREKLTFAAAATAASLVLTLAFVWGLFAWNGVPLTMENLLVALTDDAAATAEVTAVLPWIVLFAIVVSLLVCYFGVGFGAKNQLRAVARKAAKGK